MSDQALGKVYLIHAVNKIIYSEKGSIVKGKGTPYLTWEVPLLSREYSPRKPTVRCTPFPLFPSVLCFKGI